MSKTVLALLLVLSFIAPPVLGFVGVPKPTDGPRLVLVAPWQDGADLVRRAGGDPVGPVDAPLGILATSQDAADFDARLRAAGAWAVLDGSALARICGLAAADITKGTDT